MDDTVGAVAQRRRRRRKQLAIGLFILLVVIGLASVIGAALAATEEPVGTNIGLKTVFIGPPGLEVVWEGVINQTWSVSLVRGRIRNTSNTMVRFNGITYSIKDENGDVIWKETDERYIMGGMIEPFGSIYFVIYPIAGREARIFELLVKDAEVLKR
jgi:hypothetical protein